MKLKLVLSVKVALIIVVIINEICEGRKFAKEPSASDKNVIKKLEKLHREEIGCLKKIDSILHSKWLTEVNKIPTKDLGEIEPVFLSEEASKPIYYTPFQEWVMKDGSSGKKIDKCFRGIKTKIESSMGQSDVQCLNKLLKSRINGEKKLEKKFSKLLNDSSMEQLPFRRFISFHEFTELMFQNRNPDSLTSTERSVYEHAESQLSTEEDKENKLFTMQQECEWKNARALQEASNPNSRFREFEYQVRDLLNQKIGNQMIRTYSAVNLTMIIPRHEKWVKIHEGIGRRLREEISKLRTQKKSSQWLCEYASKLADIFFEEQKSILTEDEGKVSLELKTETMAEETRAVEVVLKKRKDVRQRSMNSLAKKIYNDSRCLKGLVSLVEQQHLFEAASLFMDSNYTYPELHCNIPLSNFGAISPTVCNCVGTFCAAYRLAVLFANEYEMVKGNDGVYKIVRNKNKKDGKRGKK